MLPPLVWHWPYALFWAVFAWAFVPEYRIVSRQHEPTATPQDANSKRLIAVLQGSASFAAFAVAAAVPSAAMAHRVWWFWVGVAAMLGGSLLRRHCWRMLGESFTGAVIVRPDQAIVDRGAYRYVRHPSYTAAAILLLGVGLALGNWLSLAVLVAAMVVGYGYRVVVEERALLATVGDPYRRYAARTKRFVPFLF
jgi:protein-S-isoprenylcysteine O-methyltransferase Ste14